MEDEKERILPKKQVLDMTEIKGAGDIFQILNCVRVYGRKDSKVSQKLVCLLIKQKKWEHGHGMELYELILRQYADDEILDQLLAVSGVSDDYRNLKTSAKRREKYADSHSENEKDLSTMDKSEKRALRNISIDVYDDFIDNHSRLLSIYGKWISQIGLDPEILEALHTPGEQEDQQKEPREVPTPPYGGKETGGTKEEKKDSEKGSQININIIAPISNFYNKVAIETPQYGLKILICAFIIFVVAFLVSIRSGGLSNPQIEDISVIYPNLELVAGERRDPGIDVSPAEAGKDSLRYIIEDPSIADVTREWKVIGGDGWQEGTDNTTTITLSGGHAKDVEIFVTLKPRFIGKAGKEIPTDGGVGEQQ